MNFNVIFYFLDTCFGRGISFQEANDMFVLIRVLNTHFLALK